MIPYPATLTNPSCRFIVGPLPPPPPLPSIAPPLHAASLLGCVVVPEENKRQNGQYRALWHAVNNCGAKLSSLGSCTKGGEPNLCLKL